MLLHHSRTLAFVMAAARIPERVQVRRRICSGCSSISRLGCRVPMLRQHPHAQATAWLEAAGIVLADPDPRLVVPARTRDAVARRMPAGKGPLVILGIGSSEPSKQWGSGRFIQLARGLADAGWRRFAIAGGVAEAMLAEQIRAGIGERCRGGSGHRLDAGGACGTVRRCGRSTSAMIPG